MGKQEFHNAMRILCNIDYSEFYDCMVKAGMDHKKYGNHAWQDFRGNPHDFFIKCSDSMADCLFQIIERRNKAPDRETDDG